MPACRITMRSSLSRMSSAVSTPGCPKAASAPSSGFSVCQVPQNARSRRQARAWNHHPQLAVEDVECRLDAALRERGEALRCKGARRPRPSPRGPAPLKNVGAAAEAPVDDDRGAAGHARRHLGDALDRRAQSVLHAAAVVRDPNAVGAVLRRELRVLRRRDQLPRGAALPVARTAPAETREGDSHATVRVGIEAGKRGRSPAPTKSTWRTVRRGAVRYGVRRGPSSRCRASRAPPGHPAPGAPCRGAPEAGTRTGGEDGAGFPSR